MDDSDLPRAEVDTIPGWEHDLAFALGYTLSPDGDGHRMPDGSIPTAWTLALPPFALLEETREVIAWEVDGEPDHTGIRVSRPDPYRPGEILMKPVRHPLPDGFDYVTITDTDDNRHRVVLRSAA